MFGKKARRIEQLEGEVGELRTKLEDITDDPYFVLMRELKGEVEGIVTTGENVDTRITLALNALRERLLQARAEREARKIFDAQTRAAKEKMNKEALSHANLLAARMLVAWMADGAEAYREEVAAQLNHQRPTEVIDAAKRAIRQDEFEARVAEQKAKLLAAGQADRLAAEERERRKARAAALRETTKVSEMLRLADLVEGDPLIIGFTERGRAQDALTEGREYGSSTYRSWLEKRRIEGILTDPEAGQLSVVKDSWRNTPGRREHALRGSQTVQLAAANPLEGWQVQPILVQGAELSIISVDGVQLPTDQLQVWWANLGEFRVLS